MADGVGTWNVLEWTQVTTPKHGLEKFLLEAEDVIVHKTGVVLLNTDEAGILAVTNFRLLFVSRASKCIIELGTIPLTTIEKITDDVKLTSVPRNSEKRELLQVIGKDMRVVTFAFLPKTMQRSAVMDVLKRYRKPVQLWELYAFQCDPSKFKNSNPKLRLLKEYYRFFGKRLLHLPEDESYIISNDRWRMTTINSNYTLCPTYPSVLVVPKSISDEELLQAASFRTSRRIPVISWCNPGSGAVLARSSQPRVGPFMSSRNHSDERLVAGLCSSSADSSASRRKLYIVDARPIANALANNVKGGGSESSSNYFKSEVVFLGIDNIHVMRESLSRLREYVDTHGTTSSDGTSSFLRNGGSTWGGGNLSSMSGSASTLGDTGWLTHVQNVLSGAAWIAARIALESASVLVHCSDGWDRTTQLVSLASLLLDPYYRTFKGFQALVDKDWLAFGHPFADRMGIPTVTDLATSTSTEMLTRQSSMGNASSSPLHSQSGSNLAGARGGTNHNQASDNISPILLQWVDCVFQLLRLYPCAFEFSSRFLVDFLDAVLSCRFGNFLCNCERERQQAGISEVCGCIWIYLSDLRAIGGRSHEHFNLFYDPSRHEGPILPPAAALAPTIWPQFHLRWACPSEAHASEFESMWRTMNKKYSETSKAKELAESKAKDLESKTESLSEELRKEKQKSSSALATVNRVRRENLAIKRAVQSLGCRVNLSTNQSHTSSDLMASTYSDDPSDRSPHDLSVSISAIEDAGVVSGGNPLSRVCESMCPFRTKDGCKWPNEQCAQLGSQFVGLKADFGAFENLSIDDQYFHS
ncbi:Myotubularin [Rhynchospora pubera]|uniref:Myotubularin n=1 Tax=Rhynchospora pubera TaxID=906938 RepID=A0AAV8GQ91_9POAL|nr:Myotubularin [Rhynchospora pubera]